MHDEENKYDCYQVYQSLHQKYAGLPEIYPETEGEKYPSVF